MAVGCIDNDGIDTGGYQGVNAFHGVGGDTYAGSHAEASEGILAGIGFILGFCNILVGHQADEMPLLVNYGEFLDFMALEYVGSLLEVGRLRCGDKVFGSHHLINLAVEVALEAEVAVGDDTHQHPVLVNHRDTADMVFLHDTEGIAHGGAAAYGHRVVNHAVFGALYSVHLTGLLLD